MPTSFDEAQERVMALLALAGWSNSLTPPNPAFLVNWGKSEFIRYTNYNQEIAFIATVSGQAVYAMTSDLPNFPTQSPIPLGPRLWYSLNDDALWQIIPGTPGSASYLPQTTREKIRMNDIQYLDCPPSIPLCWYIANDQQIGLYPAPTDDGTLIQFSGNRDLPDLQLGTDVFPWHDRYTEACCLFGAYYYGKTIARGEELKTVLRYLQEARELSGDFNKDFTDKEAALINREVRQPRPDYLIAGDCYIPVYQSPTQFFPGLT